MRGKVRISFPENNAPICRFEDTKRRMIWFGTRGLTDVRDRRETGAWFCVERGGITCSAAMSGDCGHQDVVNRLYQNNPGTVALELNLPDCNEYEDGHTVESIIDDLIKPMSEWLTEYATLNNGLSDYSIHHHDVISCKTLVGEDLLPKYIVRRGAGLQIRLSWSVGTRSYDDVLTYSALDVGSLYSDDSAVESSTSKALTRVGWNKRGMTMERLAYEVQRSYYFAKEYVSVQPGRYTVVMSPRSTGLFIHECFGHQAEADFRKKESGDEKLLESNQTMAPATTTEKPEVWDDGRLYGWGHCPVDDEGCTGHGVRLYAEGAMDRQMHSRQTAKSMGKASTGNGRAVDFTRDPLVRMTNTYLTAGKSSFEGLLERVQNGIYIEDIAEGNGTDLFSLAPLKCWIIENGQLTSPVKVELLTGRVDDMLQSIVDRSEVFELHAMVRGGCGKLDQFPLDVGFGGPHVLLSEVHLE